MFADTWYLFNKYMRITLRMPMWTLFSILQPLIWLLIFGELFSKMSMIPGFPEGSYVDFFVPGVLVMTVLFGSSWSGVSLLREINFGTVEKMMVTPVSRVAIVLSRLVHSSVQVLIQSVIIIAVSWALTENMTIDPVSILLCLVIIFLLGVGFAGLSNAFAIILQREEPLVAIGNLMTLPLMFFSSAMIPKAFMPEWIKYMSVVNPVDYAVESVRAALNESIGMETYLTGLVVLTFFAVSVLGWTVYKFNTKRD